MSEYGGDSGQETPQVHFAQVGTTGADTPPGRVEAAPGDTGRAEPLNPAALTVEQAARLLTAAGARHADVETIRRHIDSGAPTSAEGKINLMHYMAWLIREVSHGEDY